MSFLDLLHEDYKIGWICASPTDMAVSEALLDETHVSLAQDTIDHNSYTLGRMGTHNVVMMCLPAGERGSVTAARVQTQMRGSFRSLRYVLLVGSGSGIPSEEKDIRLGDVVVSEPDISSSGVIRFDFGRTVQGGRFMQTGTLNKPPTMLLSALARLEARHMRLDCMFPGYLLEMSARYPKMAARYAHPGTEHDILYHAQYDHPKGNETCSQCDPDKRIWRKPRHSRDPVIHFGLIASADQPIRDGVTRDKLWRDMNVDCVEMEAAGLMDEFGCLVICGISDYADSHGNKLWQPYAAANAAAYAKELLNMVPGGAIRGTPVVPGTNAESGVCGEECESLKALLYRHLQTSRQTKEQIALGFKKPPSATICRVCGKECPQRDPQSSHAGESGHDKRYILPPAHGGDLKESRVCLDEGADAEASHDNHTTLS